MTIEIHRPELEALILERMKSGAFQNVEDVLIEALKSARFPRGARAGAEECARTGAELAATQASPCQDIDLTPRPETEPVEHPLQSAAEIVLGRMRNVPPEIMATMPRDGASQHDHYIYGCQDGLGCNDPISRRLTAELP